MLTKLLTTMAAQQPPCTHSLTCMRSRLSAQSHRSSRLVVYRKIVVVCLVCLFSLHVMPPLPTTTTAPQPHCTHSPTCMLSRLSAQSHRPSFCLVYRQVSSSVVSVWPVFSLFRVFRLFFSVQRKRKKILLKTTTLSSGDD